MRISKLIMAAGLASGLMMVSGLTFAEQVAPTHANGDVQAMTQIESQQPAGGSNVQGGTVVAPDKNATQKDEGTQQPEPAAAAEGAQDKADMQGDVVQKDGAAKAGN